MMFRKYKNHKKQEKRAEKSRQEALPMEQMPEEMYRIAAEIGWSYSALPLSGFPEGPWFFY